MTMSAEGMNIVLERLDRIETLLRAREGRAMPAHPMSPKEVATVVGKSERTVLRWIEKGALREKKIGEITLIRPVDLERFLEPKGGAR